MQYPYKWIWLRQPGQVSPETRRLCFPFGTAARSFPRKRAEEMALKEEGFWGWADY